MGDEQRTWRGEAERSAGAANGQQIEGQSATPSMWAGASAALGDRLLQRKIARRAAERSISSTDGRVLEKAVDGGAARTVGAVEEIGPEGGATAKTGGDSGGKVEEKSPTPPKKKKAGVESFSVDWSKNAAGPTTAELRLDYKAKFKKDDDHDPALAEFRQNVMTKYEITDGPRKGEKGDTSPMHDDHYSRADDTAGHTINDVDFVSNDNPGFIAGSLSKDDVVDYSFTAEDMIIDTSDGNKVLERRGPHTGTIKGKDPRTYGGVPVKLS
jgi:hypothetical protein